MASLDPTRGLPLGLRALDLPIHRVSLPPEPLAHLDLARAVAPTKADISPPSLFGRVEFLLAEAAYQGYTLYRSVESTAAGAVMALERCLYHELVWGKSPPSPFKMEQAAYHHPMTSLAQKQKMASWVRWSFLDAMAVRFFPSVAGVTQSVMGVGGFLGGSWITHSLWSYTGGPLFKLLGGGSRQVESLPPSEGQQRLFWIFQMGTRLVGLAYDAMNLEVYFLSGLLFAQTQRYLLEQGEFVGPKPPPSAMEQEMRDFMDPKANRLGLVAAKIAGVALPFLVSWGIQGLVDPTICLDPAQITYFDRLKEGVAHAGFNVNRRLMQGMEVGSQDLRLGPAVAEETKRAAAALASKSLTRRLFSLLNP